MVVMLHTLTLVSLGYLAAVSCEREHKVHNIVLYPERHSWCQTTPIQQVVSSPGYKSVTIQNNVCVGACFSYSIPKTEPAEPGELIGPYCDSCQPSEITCYHVNLQAEDSNLEVPKVLQKRVEVIMNCSCQSCDKVRSEDCINHTNSIELPLSLYADPESLNRSSEDNIHPDLIDAQNSQKQYIENDTKLKNTLKKWFETYQSENSDNKNAEIADLSLDIAKKNEKINKDLEGLPKSFGVEGASSHQKGSHIGMGISHHPNDVVDPDTKTITDEVKPTHHSHHHNHHHSKDSSEHHHHHHLGEEQHLGLSVEHLIKGPHGSMVAAPTEIKLHIDGDTLKPNDEGLVVEYENHHQKQKVVDLVGTD
ncbi:uncharacterized protein LOC126750241 isoform X2 [Anthonomus grandis grandis]|uniref:uncharacterized protein LOC126750241 isoform X2 n=1 Tax=Anthonomus grandis grandis TaxID=2921223 RepID=UPI002165AF94|nr:uncharacterized protein LOC126750241 isoform X2 [Anthonomus grandis grandis]